MGFFLLYFPMCRSGELVDCGWVPLGLKDYRFVITGDGVDSLLSGLRSIYDGISGLDISPRE